MGMWGCGRPAPAPPAPGRTPRPAPGRSWAGGCPDSAGGQACSSCRPGHCTMPGGISLSSSRFCREFLSHCHGIWLLSHVQGQKAPVPCGILGTEATASAVPPGLAQYLRPLSALQQVPARGNGVLFPVSPTGAWARSVCPPGTIPPAHTLPRSHRPRLCGKARSCGLFPNFLGFMSVSITPASPLSKSFFPFFTFRRCRRRRGVLS